MRNSYKFFYLLILIIVLFVDICHADMGGTGDGGANSCFNASTKRGNILIDVAQTPFDQMPGQEIALARFNVLKQKIPFFGGLLERAKNDLTFYLANCSLKTLPEFVSGVYFGNQQVALQIAPDFARANSFDYMNYKQQNAVNPVLVDQTKLLKLEKPFANSAYTLRELQAMFLVHEVILRLVMGGYAMRELDVPAGPRWPGLVKPISGPIMYVVRAVVSDVMNSNKLSEQDLIARLAEHWKGWIFNVASNDPSFEQSPDVFNRPIESEALKGVSQFRSIIEAEQNRRANLWTIYKPMLMREIGAMDKYCANPLSSKYTGILTEKKQNWNIYPNDFGYTFLRDRKLNVLLNEDREEIAHNVNAIFSVQLLTNRIRHYSYLIIRDGKEPKLKKGLQGWEQKIAENQIHDLQAIFGANIDSIQLVNLENELSAFMRLDAFRLVNDIGNTMDKDNFRVLIWIDPTSNDYQSKIVSLSQESKAQIASHKATAWEPDVDSYLALSNHCKHWLQHRVQMNRERLPEALPQSYGKAAKHSNP